MNKSKKTIQRKIGGVARQHRNSWDVRRGMSTIDKFQPPSAQVRHSAVNPHQHFLTVFSSLLSLHRPISCFLCLSTVTVLSLCLYSFSCSIFHLIIKYAFLALAQFKIRNPWGLYDVKQHQRQVFLREQGLCQELYTRGNEEPNWLRMRLGGVLVLCIE